MSGFITVEDSCSTRKENKEDMALECSADHGRLKRQMGLFSAVAVLVGNTIGSGIFITPSTVFLDSGSVGVDLLVWIAAGVASIIHGVCVAELGIMLPAAGGLYEYVSVCVKSMGRTGDVLSFLFVWLFIVADCMGATLHGFTFTSYALSAIYGTCKPPRLVTALLTVAVIELAAVVNTLSLKTSMKIQNIFFVIKIAVLIAIIVTGVVWCIRDPILLGNFSFRGNTTTTKVVEAFGVALLAGSGGAMICCMAEEMLEPTRTIPRALLGGLTLVTSLHVFTNFAYFLALDRDDFASSDATAVTFARRTWGLPGRYLVPSIVCVCTFGAMSASSFSNSRLLFAAARKKHLPAVFSLVTAKSSLPVMAITCRSCISIAFAVTGSVTFLAKGAATLIAAGNFMVVVAMVRMRVTMKHVPRPIKMPAVLIAADMAILLVVVLIPAFGSQGASQYVVALGIVLMGLPTYVIWKASYRANFGSKIYLFFQKLLLCVSCAHNEPINSDKLCMLECFCCSLPVVITESIAWNQRRWT
ncbi:b(0,+)-type amino acid transporter 1-like [Haemaphysalis longicornis]